jgi:endonuclease III
MKPLNSGGNWLRRFATRLRLGAFLSDSKITESATIIDSTTITEPAANFTQKLREKYPQQSPISDEQLIEAFIQKNPQYRVTYRGITPVSVSWSSELSVLVTDQPAAAAGTATVAEDSTETTADAGEEAAHSDTKQRIVAGGVESENDRSERMRQIASLLLENRPQPEDWGEISNFKDGGCPKKVANQFLICCLLDYQMDANVAWQNGIRLVKEILGNPEDVWQEITKFPRHEWASKSKEHNIHRFYNRAHDRLWRVSEVMCNGYDGNANNIWVNKESSVAVERLRALGAGEQISNMIVGALRDCGQVVGSSDVKADVHVCRVLGRAVHGEEINPNAAIELARQLHRDDPWKLDWPIWNVGTTYCKKSVPECSGCYLKEDCAYALKS